MRELLILLLIGGLAYLGYDDYIKRDALKQAHEQIQQLSQGQPATAAARTSGRPVLNPPTVWNPPTPGWMQDRLSERPVTDSAVRHKQHDEDANRSSQYGSAKPR
jgi:hypothetical protein